MYKLVTMKQLSNPFEFPFSATFQSYSCLPLHSFVILFAHSLYLFFLPIPPSPQCFALSLSNLYLPVSLSLSSSLSLALSPSPSLSLLDVCLDIVNCL